jgi:hypothetical protein
VTSIAVRSIDAAFVFWTTLAKFNVTVTLVDRFEPRCELPRCLHVGGYVTPVCACVGVGVGVCLFVHLCVSVCVHVCACVCHTISVFSKRVPSCGVTRFSCLCARNPYAPQFPINNKGMTV